MASFPPPGARAARFRGRRGRPGPLLPLLLALPLAGGLLGCGDSTSTTPGGPDPAPPPDPSGPSPPPTPTRLPAVIGNPCPGVVVRSDPPTASGDTLLAQQLVIEWENRSGGAAFTWAGPYEVLPNPDPEQPPTLDVALFDWSVETTATVTRHTFGVGWPSSAELRLDLGSGGAGCETPTLVCGAARCELRRQS